MRLESFVVLGIVLLVWMLAAFASRLRQMFEAQSPDSQDADLPAAPQAGPPLSECGAVGPDAESSGAREDQVAASRAVSVTRRPRPSSIRARCRSPRAAREGVVMMTVLGPCRALDRREESRLRGG